LPHSQTTTHNNTLLAHNSKYKNLTLLNILLFWNKKICKLCDCLYLIYFHQKCLKNTSSFKFSDSVIRPPIILEFCVCKFSTLNEQFMMLVHLN